MADGGPVDGDVPHPHAGQPGLSAPEAVSADTGSDPALPPEAEPAAPSSGRMRRRLVLGTVVVAAVAAVAGGTALAATSYRDQIAPEKVVLDYLTAVAAGDSAGALAYGGLPEGDQSMLTPDVLAAQLAIAPMSGVTVESVRTAPGQAAADVSYELGFVDGPVTVNDTIPLTRDGRSWRLTAAAIPVSFLVENASHHATVAGAAVPTGSGLVFPGATPIAFDSPNVQLSESSRVARFAEEHDVAEVATLSPVGEEVVGAAVDAALAACLDGTAPEPTLCPLPVDVRAVPGSLRGEVVAPPSDAVPMALVAGHDALVRLSGEVTVTGEYVQLDYNNQRVAQTGEFPLKILLVCYASAPDEIIWRPT